MNTISRSTSVFGCPASACVARTPSHIPQAHLSSACIQQRHASSYRRQRKLLNIPPAPSFGGSPLPTGSSGRSKTANERRPPGDHIIFNPPSSAPNVYHTPLKFLPETDPRKRLLEKALSTPQPQPSSTPAQPSPAAISQTAFPAAPPSSLPAHRPRVENLTPGIPQGTNFAHQWPSTHELPPRLRPDYKKSYHLSPEQIEEMRQLRLEDDETWTRGKLAEKFGCTPFFVGLVVHASDERKARIKAETERRQARWWKYGGVSLKTRRERQKRKAVWMAEA